jgi:GT2 family glycosyltransferase
VSDRAAGVAVIVVNWNAGELLTRCLRALDRQTVQPDKVFVVDNASQDGSCDRIGVEFPRTTLIRLPHNTGFAAANNLAARECGGCAWIALLNPDAFPEPAWLEALLGAASRRPEYSFFGSRMLMADDPARLDGVGDAYHVSGLVWREAHGAPAAGAFLQEREIFSPSAAAAMYRRDLFLDAGGFDEDYFCYVEDVDLGFRLRLLGHRCLYVPDSVVAHKGSALTGRRSDFSIFHGHRNLVWTYVKNFPAPWFWLYLPLHLALNLATPFAFIGGGFAAACRAKWSALRGLPRAWRKRRGIQRRARVAWRELSPHMSGGVGSLFRLLAGRAGSEG